MSARRPGRGFRRSLDQDSWTAQLQGAPASSESMSVMPSGAVVPTSTVSCGSHYLCVAIELLKCVSCDRETAFLIVFESNSLKFEFQ